jgi:hypothetical protein
MVDRLPAMLLRAEGAALLVGAVVLYFHADYAWWLFVVLLLAPDLAAAGYLLGPRIGAAVYDLGHLEAFPIVLAVVGVVTDSDVCLKLALIWLTHIGMDRAVGYGLKYPTGFKDTHLQRV